MLMNFTAKEHKKRKLESDLFLSAVDTGRGFSVNFVMSHCVDFSKWTLDQKADLGKVVWRKLAASSWASDVLSVLLSTSLAEGMMLAVIQEACFECVGLLQSWATKNPPKSSSWIGWSETELSLRLSSGGHGSTSFLEVLAQWLQLPFVLFGIISLLQVGKGTTGGPSDTAVARFIPSLAHAGKNLTKVHLAYVFWDVKVGSSLRPLGEQMPLLEEISFAHYHSYHPYISADVVKALFLDGAGNFRFPKLQKVDSLYLLNDEAAVAWAKIEQIHKIPSVDLDLEKVTDVGRAALKPPPSDAEIRDLCKANASRSDSEQLALESNLLGIALDRGFLVTMRSVLDYCISFAKWNYTARLSILDTGTRRGIDYSTGSWPKLLRSKTSDEKLSMMLNTSFAECLVVTAAEYFDEKCVGLLQSWAAQNKPKGAWIDWSGTELELALNRVKGYVYTTPVITLLDRFSQWLQLPFILFGIKSLEVGLPGPSSYRVTKFKSELMRDEVRLSRSKLVQSLTHAGQNLTALKIANFLVVLNNASALRLFGPLPLLQTMLLAEEAGDWHVSMSADAVKALFLDDAGNFKFPKLQNLSIQLLDDRAAVELSTVMQGRKMKALRVPKLSNLTDVGWATVNRLKTELGLATTS